MNSSKALLRRVVVAEVDAVKTTITERSWIKRWSCTFFKCLSVTEPCTGEYPCLFHGCRKPRHSTGQVVTEPDS